MDNARFNDMTARLERESIASPGAYKSKVALLALFGFVVLAIVLGVASLGLLAIAGIAIAIVVTGGKAVVLLFKLGKFLIVLAVPLWVLIKSSLSTLFTRLPAPQGQEITRSQAPQLFAAIDDMRARMKGPKFHHVLVIDDMNAAVMQRPLFGLFGFPRNYLLLGLPLLESLSAEEALAVVAHEYGHLSGAHSRFSAFIYRLRNTWGTIQELAAQWQGWAGRMLGRLVAWYAPYFNAYTFVLARANEYQADAASAELVSPAVAANALKRVNITAALYQQFFSRIFAGVAATPTPPADIAVRWSQDAIVPPPASQATQWLVESLNREKSAFDTHPVLRDRLKALPGQENTIDQPPPPLTEPSAAVRWLGDYASTLREAHQQDWTNRIQEQWREKHEQLQLQLKRLAELRALDAPDLQQTAERLRLQVELEPDVDHLPELSAFNEAQPDHAGAQFLEGSIRLERDDEAGLARLERAMELDGDAIKPACDRAYGFLMKRGDVERAKSYEQRWRTRHDWEITRDAQISNFDPRQPVQPHQLDAERLEFVQRNLAANAKGVRRVWLARREIPADPAAESFVVYVQPTFWARFRSKDAEIIDRLASIEWPMHIFFCTNKGPNKVLMGRIRKLADSQVYGR